MKSSLNVEKRRSNIYLKRKRRKWRGGMTSGEKRGSAALGAHGARPRLAAWRRLKMKEAWRLRIGNPA